MVKSLGLYNDETGDMCTGVHVFNQDEKVWVKEEIRFYAKGFVNRKYEK